jgi:hypothetical protein
MMGNKQRSFAPLVQVSLEELVPSDHFYRHLERTLDLSFVREFVQRTYNKYIQATFWKMRSTGEEGGIHASTTGDTGSHSRSVEGLRRLLSQNARCTVAHACSK